MANHLPHFHADLVLTISRRFHGEFFTFSVGPDEVKMSAHENVISQSPVLKACCKPNFKEGLTKHIELPEDNPETFHLLLEYLYTGVLQKPGPTIEDNMDEWAGLYILADKYKLDVLKTEILTSLDVKPLLTGPIIYLKWIHEIYANVPDSEMQIASFFSSISLRILPFAHSDMTEVDKLTESGGRFAVALSRHQNSECIGHRTGEQEKEKELKALKDKGKKDLEAVRVSAEQEMQRLKVSAEKEMQKLKDKIEKFKKDHSSYHHGYTRCTCTDNI
jgi:hypothetical protein